MIIKPPPCPACAGDQFRPSGYRDEWICSCGFEISGELFCSSHEHADPASYMRSHGELRFPCGCWYDLGTFGDVAATRAEHKRQCPVIAKAKRSANTKCPHHVQPCPCHTCHPGFLAIPPGAKRDQVWREIQARNAAAVKPNTAMEVRARARSKSAIRGLPDRNYGWPAAGELGPAVMTKKAPAACPIATRSLDTRYDGVTLRELLGWYELDCREVGGSSDRRVWSAAQRAAVSAHWSAELRAKVEAGKRAERDRVVRDDDDGVLMGAEDVP